MGQVLPKRLSYLIKKPEKLVKMVEGIEQGHRWVEDMAGKNEELEKINSPREQQFRIYLAVSDNSQLPWPRIEEELAGVEERGSVSWSQSVTIKTEEDSNETQDS